MKFHKDARADITKFWKDLYCIIDQRSFQFNDRLISIIELFNVFPYELQSSFTDAEENWNFFIGNVSMDDAPSGNDSKIQVLWDVGIKLLQKVLKVKLNVEMTLDAVRIKLCGEWLKFKEEKAKHYTGPPNPINFWRWHKGQKYFPLLAVLVEELFQISVSSVDCERSFKTQSLIYTPERNRLSTSKLNEEMKIIYNKNASNKLEGRSERIEGCFLLNMKLCEVYRYKMFEEEEFIEEMDQYEEPRNTVRKDKEKKQKTVEKTLLGRYVKKSKEWKSIENDPSYAGDKKTRRIGAQKHSSFHGMEE